MGRDFLEVLREVYVAVDEGPDPLAEFRLGAVFGRLGGQENGLVGDEVVVRRVRHQELAVRQFHLLRFGDLPVAAEGEEGFPLFRPVQEFDERPVWEASRRAGACAAGVPRSLFVGACRLSFSDITGIKEETKTALSLGEVYFGSFPRFPPDATLVG